MINRFLKNNQRGQILYFALTSILVLSLFWITLVNVAQIIKTRILMQHAADAAAQTVGCIQARALNQIGTTNFVLGSVLIIPSFIYIPEINCNGALVEYHGDGNLVGNLRKWIETLILSQDITKLYGETYSFYAAQKVAENMGADGIIPLDFQGLGLERNKGDIWYWKTLNAGAGLGSYHGHIFLPDFFSVDIVRNTDRWYQQGEHFKNKLVRVIAYKKMDKWFPLGKQVLGLKNEVPTVQAIAACRVYNVAGAMFPVPSSSIDFTSLIPKIDWYPTLKLSWNDFNLGNRSGLEAVSSYLKAMLGGWEAHLVPVAITEGENSLTFKH